MPPTGRRQTRHAAIFETLQREISAGRFAANGRLPGEIELTRRFRVSRPTVARALDGLRSQGLIERRPGAGTFLRRTVAVSAGLLGLIGAGIDHTEILGPIGAELARSAQDAGHRLILGDSGRSERDAERLTREFLARGVSGVFLAPLEVARQRELINRRLVTLLRDAGIAVILLDRDLLDFPGRSDLDLVAVDDVRAGFQVASHLLRGGRRHLVFVARPGFPSTTDLRIAGCRQAAAQAGAAVSVHIGDPGAEAFVRGFATPGVKTAVVCANDATAATLLATLQRLRLAVPTTVRVAGFDDVGRAAGAEVPLTTMRLPCRELGLIAVRTLLERIREPRLPPRQVLLDARLVVRRSSG
jgi:DNA-binding LacI/PurR family transcriptional regulator